VCPRGLVKRVASHFGHSVGITASMLSYPPGETPTAATGASANGCTFVGSGIKPSGNTEAWSATILAMSHIILVLVGFASLVGGG